MLSLFNRTDSRGSRVGLSLSDEGVALAYVRGRGAGERPRLDYCRFSRGDASGQLAALSRELPSHRAPAAEALEAGSYHLLLVEAPEVPVDELRAAIRWRIKDLIDFHIDDAVIDVFQMPAQGRGGINKMMYAVAARADLVRGRIDAAEAAGLRLDAVEIAELSLRNVARLLEEDGHGVSLLYLGDRHSVLLIVKQGVLYQTRRIETGIETLAAASGLRSELIAGLALETRRSLDYFESHHEQSSIPVLYTMGLGVSDQDLLRSDLGLTVRNVDVTNMLDSSLELDDDTQRRCLPAIGAALREDPVSL
jgi:MSHA biogenesis protein MshI